MAAALVVALVAAGLGLCLCGSGPEMANEHGCCGPEGSETTVGVAACAVDCCAPAPAADATCVTGATLVSQGSAAAGPVVPEPPAPRWAVHRTPAPSPPSLTTPILRI